MGLWFFEETAPFAFSLADELTTVKAALIRAGALDEVGPHAPACEVIDLRAVRLARLGEGGTDA
jgi:hypothetical protein